MAVVRACRGRRVRGDEPLSGGGAPARSGLRRARMPDLAPGHGRSAAPLVGARRGDRPGREAGGGGADTPRTAQPRGPGPLRGDDPNPAVRRPLHPTRPGAAIPRALEYLADLEPRTLAVMHGSSFEGDGGAALRELARAWPAHPSAPVEGIVGAGWLGK